MTNPPALVSDLLVTDLGRMAYAAAFDLQQQIHADVLDGRRPPTVLLLEHDPVITVSRRDSAAANLLASPAQLQAAGVELCQTDRGGDITYHGPGQLVVYPIIPLERYRLNVRQYVHLLEGVIIETLAAFGVEAQRDACAVGVWVQEAKIAAIGVRVRRWVTLHGLALNVTTDLSHFKLINPCGLSRPVTSLERLLGPACPSMPQVKARLQHALAGALTK